ncbi:NERD domain-containing protein [Aquibacillus koreensis]|uniref:NERD domain-containing protein n=1 Tax=Aquibacillus koreensis TaxID=279446 RepID=A0A9X3WJA0_9BACI|nr:NERD domain-containing protein [Aquibacillus koreensis]MCT2534761.1 NERD domain-containing protein [Aquibacillus koreensis]MDC3419628.1 NERD domain-containing protein [Aquibacillus koreensis]
MLNFFKKKEKKQAKKNPVAKEKAPSKSSTGRSQEELATVKGQIGEHKIDIQLAQLPKEYKYINDLMVKNSKSKTGYSQIDHIVISPYGIFVIETKNYQGTIYGGKDRKTWLINGKFKFMNPFHQNYGHVEGLKQLIDSKHHDAFISMVSFTKRCTFKIDLELRKIHSNDLIVYDIELSEFIHRKVSVNKLQNQEPFLSEDEVNEVYSLFIGVNITDEKIREQHNQAIKEKSNKAEKALSKCVVCDKPVSEKVKNYCLSSKKFGGKVYCFEHQKNIC